MLSFAKVGVEKLFLNFFLILKNFLLTDIEIKYITIYWLNLNPQLPICITNILLNAVNVKYKIIAHNAHIDIKYDENLISVYKCIAIYENYWYI